MQGKAVSEGIAIGVLTVYRKHIRTGSISGYLGSVDEISRFNAARTEAVRQLEQLKDAADKEGNSVNVALLNSYLVMAQDPAYVEAVEKRIRENPLPAEVAVEKARDSICRLFSSMDDEYMRARAEDISDISDRVLRILMGQNHPVVSVPDGKVILLADDLTPSETMQLDKDSILAFVTRRGSNLSHTAILARSMNIPAIVAIDYPADCDGKTAIVDAYSGTLIIDPTEAELDSYRKRKEELELREKTLAALKSEECMTLDGKHIGLMANVGSIDDIKKAVEYGCEGIGLFRSELFYLDRDDYPSEEEQFKTYVEAVRLLDGKELIVRTIDIGADKQEPYMQFKHEDNPAMGMRAVRYCLGHKNVFRTQIKAIMRAAVYGPISILIPMLISIEEVWQVRSVIAEAKSELDREGAEYRVCRLGAMIETPAAAVISDLMAKEVDFLSIGTNDLTQYTLAVDRQNTELEFICDYHHQAILRLLNTIISNAHDHGKKVCVCGELAADTTFTGDLLRMGVDELSVAPGSILKVKQAVRGSRIKV